MAREHRDDDHPEPDRFVRRTGMHVLQPGRPPTLKKLPEPPPRSPKRASE